MTTNSLPLVIEGAEAPLDVPPLARVEIYVYRAPIDTPVRTAFGTMTERPAVLVRVEDGDGAFGWGEIWCNFPACGAEHRARLAASVIAPLLLHRGFRSPIEAWEQLTGETRILCLQTREFGPIAQTIAGVDIALWDLVARRADLPLWQLLGDAGSRPLIRMYASGINPGGAAETVARAREAGYSAFKIKIGFGAATDAAVVKAVTESLGADEELMLDANQAWTPAQAREYLPVLAAAEPRWLEEPLPADSPLADWRNLAAESFIPLAGGENLADADAFLATIDEGFLGVVQPDLCKWGGFSRCIPIARYASQAHRRYCPHYLGGGIGLIASAHALAAVGGDGLLEVDCNANPLREALAQPMPTMQDHALELPTAAGLGVEPDAATVRPWQTLHLSRH